MVGGGTSAIGFLMELENVAGSITWVARRPVEFLEDQELNIEAGVSAVAMQDEAAREGRALPSIVSTTGVPRTRRIQAAIDRGLLHVTPMFSSIEPDGIRWSNGAYQHADAIIWATGFRPELRHLAPLKLREKAGGDHRRAGRVVAQPARLLRRVRAHGIHHRREPRGPHHRPAGRRDAELAALLGVLRRAGDSRRSGELGVADVPISMIETFSRTSGVVGLAAKQSKVDAWSISAAATEQSTIGDRRDHGLNSICGCHGCRSSRIEPAASSWHRDAVAGAVRARTPTPGAAPTVRALDAEEHVAAVADVTVQQRCAVVTVSSASQTKDARARSTRSSSRPRRAVGHEPR